jgi:NAD(P)-dependent dehydrogenase (short-subunit alcohol dehydrogenase family)
VKRVRILGSMNDSSPTFSSDRITTPFGFETTALEVVDGVDLSGKRAIVTGGASGIGVETVRALAQAGAEVTIAARKIDAAEAVAADVRESTGNDAVAVGELELVDRDSVERFVAAWDGPLDILVNNAGVMAIQDLERSPEGHEMQFATNHLGHFRLVLGLQEALAAAPNGARIVSVSSSGHLRSPVIFDDLDFRFRDYDPWAGYGQSKSANVLLAVAVTRRWSSAGIYANALMPGGIMTNLQRHVDAERMRRMVEESDGRIRPKTPEQGAATSVLLAAHPLLKGVGGRYFEDCNEAPVVAARPQTGMGGVAPYALDPVNAERLWAVSEELIA